MSKKLLSLNFSQLGNVAPKPWFTLMFQRKLLLLYRIINTKSKLINKQLRFGVKARNLNNAGKAFTFARFYAINCELIKYRVTKRRFRCNSCKSVEF